MTSCHGVPKSFWLGLSCDVEIYWYLSYFEIDVNEIFHFKPYLSFRNNICTNKKFITDTKHSIKSHIHVLLVCTCFSTYFFKCSCYFYYYFSDCFEKYTCVTYLWFLDSISMFQIQPVKQYQIGKVLLCLENLIMYV